MEDHPSCCQKVEEGRMVNSQSEKGIQEASMILLTEMEETAVLSVLLGYGRSPWEEDNKDKGTRRRKWPS